MKRKELERRLMDEGWWLVRHGGSHDVWTNGKKKVALPRHDEIAEKTAIAILKEARGAR